MALNPFFLQGSQSEQRLTQDLINEHLKIFWCRSNLYRKFVRKQTIIKKFNHLLLMIIFIRGICEYLRVMVVKETS